MPLWLLILPLWVFGFYIALEDFRTRLISVWAIVLFTAAAFCIYFYGHSLGEYLWNLAFCVCYFTVCFAVIKIIFFIRTKKFEKITGSKIGMGDVILILATGGLLSPEVLMFFFTVVFTLSLLLQLIFFKKNPALPLAGFLTIMYSAYISCLYLMA